MVDGISSDRPKPLMSKIPERLQLQPEALVCEPEDETQAAPLSDQAATMPSGRARANYSLDQLQAASDLQLAVSDRNGLNVKGRDDITGTLDGSVSINGDVLHDALKGLVGTKSGDAKITGMRFDSKSSTYVLSLKADVFWFIHDDLELKIRTDHTGRLYLQVDENWTPDSSVLSRVRSALEKMLKEKINSQQDIVSIALDIQRNGDKLYLAPVLEAIKVPLGKGQQLAIEGLNTAKAASFQLDSTGNLHVNFDSLHFSGSSDAKGPKALTQTKADSAELQINAEVFKDNSVEVNAEGRLSLDLDQKDTQQIAFGGENLGKRVESARLEASIDTDLSIDPQQKIQVESRNQWRIEDAKIQGRKYDIVSDQIEVALDTKSGLKLEIRTPRPKPPAFNPKLSQNVVEPFIGGPTYYKEMMQAIAGARESIEQETFLMYAGDKTKSIMRALALKAAGLKEGSSRLISDPIAAKGIPVRVLFNNNKLNHEGALPTIQQFEATLKELEAEIQKLPISAKAKQDYTQRLHDNLKWGSLERGVAKADHRKLLLIDGKTGYTGGINMGNHFLQQDSYHDIMMKVNGPAVREMQDAFIENWKDFTGLEQTDWNTKSVKELEKHRDRYAREHHTKPTGVDIVTTDERSNEIEAAYLHAIENATDTIYVEQAYYFYPPVQEALKRALARNVSIQMIVPERSDEELFDIINLEQIRDLMETQQRLGKGEVKAYLYTGDPGQYSHTVHTKALSADGKMAVVGSANLLPRSLRSPFSEELSDGNRRQVLFNEEMSVYLEGEQVKTLEQQLFEKDKAKTITLDLQEVRRRIQKLGGEKELQESLIKAQLS